MMSLGDALRLKQRISSFEDAPPAAAGEAGAAKPTTPPLIKDA
jgi:hypothetical protein